MVYDCTKAKDFLHELSRFMVACNKAKNPIPCAGCPLAIYDVEFLCLGKTTFASGIFYEISENKFNDIVKGLQKWSDTHPEKRELTPDEVAILKGLRVLKYKYIARDKNSEICAYKIKPHKCDRCWDVKENTIFNIIFLNDHKNVFDGILSFDDEEPEEIEELLKWAKE